MTPYQAGAMGFFLLAFVVVVGGFLMMLYLITHEDED